MGRHRRVSHAPEPPAVAYQYQYSQYSQYSYDAGPRQERGSHRRPVAAPTRGGFSARAGLLGASAAMAMGAVAVASTMVPQPGGTSGTQYSDRIQADGPPDQSPEVPSIPSPEGGAESPGGEVGEGTGGNVPPPSPGDGERPQGPGSGERPSEPGGGSSGDDSSQPSDPGGNGNGNGSENGNSGGKGNGNGSSESGNSRPSATETAEAEVLSLVNEERDDAGCKPLKNDPELEELAGEFSRDMGILGFFSHLAPDGTTPWDRAEDAGILELGGENIARGQEDAEAVMDAWMDSPGHRANILNCDYRTLGVGAYLSDDSGPLWTQNFGY